HLRLLGLGLRGLGVLRRRRRRLCRCVRRRGGLGDADRGEAADDQRNEKLAHCVPPMCQNITLASSRPVVTAPAVATSPGIMNEWFSTYLPIFVVPDRSKLIAAISEP